VPALLAVMAVVGYTAMAGLPWWAVVAVVLLTAGLAGWTGSHRASTGQQPARPTTDRGPTVPTVPTTPAAPAVVPISMSVRMTRPDEYAHHTQPASADKQEVPSY
jgi:hypothetical protein